MRFYATATPSGGAVRLLFGLPPTVGPLIYATTAATPPDLSNPNHGARLVVAPAANFTAHFSNVIQGDSTLGLYEAESVHIALEHPQLRYFQMLDLHESLRQHPTIHYHMRHGVTWITRAVNAQTPRTTALVGIARDLVRNRLSYHLGLAVAATTLRPRAGVIPILEQETLNKDQPQPCILIRETLSPAGLDAIGKHAGQSDDQLERRYRYRCRVDLLALSEVPAERTVLANVIHGAILQDFMLYDDAGYRNIEIVRSMRGAVTPDDRLQFAEEITLDGMIEVVTLEPLQVRVRDMSASLVPLRRD